MKNLIAYSTFLMSLSFVANASAQITLSKISPDTFRIQNFPMKIWHEGKRIKKPRQIQSILLAKNDAQINRDWQQAKTLRNVGTGIMVVGLAIETAGFLKTVQGEGDENNLVLKGVSVMLVGTIVQAIGAGPVKRALRRYNGLQTGRFQPTVEPPMPSVLKNTETPKIEAPPIRAGSQKPENQFVGTSGQTLQAEVPVSRVALHFGLNASKSWEIGGSKELQSDEKIWWAKSLPVAVSYEFPGSRPDNAFSLELSFLSKGFREKSETTGPNGSSKSHSDLQMRFVQLAGLKKLPLGPQLQKLRFSASGGVFLGYAIGVRYKARSVVKYEDMKTWSRSILKAEFGDEFGQINSKRFDAGLTAGAGVSYPFGPGRLLLDARFSIGAMNLENRKSPFPDWKRPSLHSRDLTFLLGYSMPLDDGF